MPYKMGACKGCKARAQWLAKQANNAKQYVARAISPAKPKGRK